MARTRIGDDQDKKKRFKTIKKQAKSVAKELFLPFLLLLATLILVYFYAKRKEADWMTLLGYLSVIVTLITGELAFLTWLKIQRMRSAGSLFPEQAGDNTAILIIDIGDSSIEGNVLSFCQESGKFDEVISGSGFMNSDVFSDINKVIESSGYTINKIEEKSRVLCVSRARIVNIKESAEDVYKAFCQINNALHFNGIKELHIFYKGPVIIPFYIGELFSNQYDTYIYKYLRGQEKEESETYTCCGIMDHNEYYGVS